MSLHKAQENTPVCCSYHSGIITPQQVHQHTQNAISRAGGLRILQLRLRPTMRAILCWCLCQRFLFWTSQPPPDSGCGSWSGCTSQIPSKASLRRRNWFTNSIWVQRQYISPETNKIVIHSKVSWKSCCWRETMATKRNACMTRLPHVKFGYDWFAVTVYNALFMLRLQRRPFKAAAL